MRHPFGSTGPPREHRTPAAAAVAAAAVALLVAGCGGGDGGTGGAYGGGSTTATSQRASGALAVRTTDLGEILVDGRGRTLYLFEQDKAGKSSCSGACASAWPPLTASGQPQAATGVDEQKLSTTRRRDGTEQVVYAGHPLYRYAPDTEPGDTKGQGLDQFGAEWYVVSPAGEKVEEGES